MWGGERGNKGYHIHKSENYESHELGHFGSVSANRSQSWQRCDNEETAGDDIDITNCNTKLSQIDAMAMLFLQPHFIHWTALEDTHEECFAVCSSDNEGDQIGHPSSGLDQLCLCLREQFDVDDA